MEEGKSQERKEKETKRTCGIKKKMGSDCGRPEPVPGPGIAELLLRNHEEQNGKITSCGVDTRGKWTWTSDGLAYGCLSSIDFSWTKEFGETGLTNWYLVLFCYSLSRTIAMYPSESVANS